MLLPSGTNVPDGPWCLLFPKDTTMKKLVLAVAVLGTVWGVISVTATSSATTTVENAAALRAAAIDAASK